MIAEVAQELKGDFIEKLYLNLQIVQKRNGDYELINLQV